MRQELSFVTFVHDPKLAQVHILSSESRTGSGGCKYVLNLKIRLTFDSDFLTRLTKALSVYWELQVEMVHDQLYLPLGDTSLEDFLLRRKKLATDYEFRVEMGFRSTFGPIYSNIVNERF